MLCSINRDLLTIVSGSHLIKSHLFLHRFGLVCPKIFFTFDLFSTKETVPQVNGTNYGLNYNCISELCLYAGRLNTASKPLEKDNNDLFALLLTGPAAHNTTLIKHYTNTKHPVKYHQHSSILGHKYHSNTLAESLLCADNKTLLFDTSNDMYLQPV